MKKSPLILLVEDGPDDAHLVREALRTSGFGNPVEVLESGDQAIVYLEGAHPYSDRGNYPLPGVIFLDLKLTRLSGFDVLKHMKDNPALAGIRSIVLTGSRHPADTEKAFLLGAHSYLVKPATFTELVELLHATLAPVLGRSTDTRPL